MKTKHRSANCITNKLYDILYNILGKFIYLFNGFECPHSLVNILGIVVANSDD